MSNLDRIYDLNLDLVYKVQNDEMEFSVNDVNTSMFYVTFTRNRKEVLDLRGKSVVFYIVKPNGNVVYTNLQYDLEQERFYCDLTTGFKNILGNYVGQIVVYDSETEERVVIPTHISFAVVSDILETSMGDVDEEEQMTILEGLIKDISSWSGKIDEAVNKANESLNMVEGAKQIALTNQNDISNLGREISQIKEKYTTKEYVDNVIEEIDITGQLGDYATKDYVDDAIDSVDVTEQLKDYAKSKDIPTKVSQLTNDKGYLTEHQSLEGYATENYVTTEIAKAQLNGGDVDIDLSGYATKDEIPTKISQLINDSNFLTEHQSLDEYAKKIELHSHSNKSALDNISLSSITNWNNHIQSTHAPSNAQKNSDITKSEIEAKLTGDITSHTHSQYLTEHQDISHLASKEYVDDAIDSVDVTEQLKDYATKSYVNTEIEGLEKIETSSTEPTDENVSIWIDTSKDSSAYIMPRINDSTTSNSTVWSSEKTYSAILDAQLKGEDIDLSAYALKTEIPTSTSKLINDSGYITEDEVISKGYITEDEVISKGYATEEYVSDAINNAKLEGGDSEIDLSIYAKTSDIPTKVSQLENDKNYLTEHQSLEGYATENYVDEKVADMIDSAPETLDTLNELAQALGDDPNFATTIATGIGKKADKTELEKLATTVSETYTTKNEFNNLSIGGRNLIRNSAFLDGTTYWDCANNPNTTTTVDGDMVFNGHPSLKMVSSGWTTAKWYGARNWEIPRGDASIKAEETVTISCWYYVRDKSKFDSSMGFEIKGIKDDGTDSTAIYILVQPNDIVENKWTRVSKTTKVPYNFNNIYAFLYVTQNGEVWFADIKFEKGDKATAWTPAPEDYSTTTEMNSAIQQKADSILSTVSTNYPDNSEMNSAIQQKADSITSTVSATYTTKSDFNNLTIGGTNLLTNSAFSDGLKNWNLNGYSNNGDITNADATFTSNNHNTLRVNSSGATSYQYRGVYKRVTGDFKKGTPLTMSCLYYVEDSSTVDEGIAIEIKGRVKGGSTFQGGLAYTSRSNKSGTLVSKEWSKITGLAILKEDYEQLEILMYVLQNGKVWFAEPKLEKGNKATDWSPAPEDYSTTTQMNSAIEQKANSITQTIASTYTTKDEFNNLSIGGRNLALDTNSYYAGWTWSLGQGGYERTDFVEDGVICAKLTRDNVEMTGWSVISYNHTKIKLNLLKPNTQYVVSFDVKTDIVMNFSCSIRHMNGQHLLVVVEKPTVPNTVPNEWTTVSCVLTTLDTLELNEQVLYLSPNNSDTGRSYSFRNLKIEEGNKPTAWTPALEDIQGEIDKISDNLAIDNTNLFRYSRPYLLDSSGVSGKYNVGRGTLIRDTLWPLSGYDECYSLALSSGQSNAYCELKNEYREMQVVEGQTYYLSLDFAFSEYCTGINVHLYQSNTWITNLFGLTKTTPDSNVIKRHGEKSWTATFTGTVYLTIYNAGTLDATKESILYLDNIKFEKGNKATTWSPNPADVRGTVDTVSSELKQTAENITNTVSATYTTKDEFNNLSIGGRNLIPNSGNFTDSLGKWIRNSEVNTIEIDSTVKYAGFNTIKINNQTNEGMAYSGYIYNLKPNTVYTYSITAKSSKKLIAIGDEPLHMWLKENPNDSNSHRETILSISHASIDTEWGRSYVVFKTPNDSESYVWKPFIYYNTIGGNPRPIIHVANFQLEEGNRPTAWSPALEEYSTTIQMNSAIQQKADSITSTVANTYTTKDEFNNFSIGGTNILSKEYIVPRGGHDHAVNDFVYSMRVNNQYQGISAIPEFSDLLTIGEVYTLQFKFRKVSGQLDHVGMHIDGGTFRIEGSTCDGEYKNITNPTSSTWNVNDGNWHICIIRMRKYATTPSTTTSLFSIQPNRETTNEVIAEIKDIKFEKGSKMTDWSPAPKDMVSTTQMDSAIEQKLVDYVTDSELSAKKFATESYVGAQIANLVDSAPDAMNTLNELATAINSNKGIYDSYITTHAEDMAQQRIELQAEIDVKANKSDIPTKTSQLTNDSNYLTSIPSEYVTDSELNAKGYLTQHQSLTDYAKKTDLHSHSNKSVLDGITSTKVSNWDNKSNLALGTTSSTAYRGDLGNTAYQHSQSAHAPSNAQKNSDITKAEIEAKLTGDITSHTHLTPRPSKYFINGYAGMTADGVMEVAKYQDWHNTSDDPNDYSVRVMCDSSNRNIVTLPQTSGRLALIEDVPSIIANSKERITYRGNAGSSWIYFPLIQFTPDNNTNYGNVTISGRIGGWEEGNSATYSMTLINRSSLKDGNTITATVQAMGNLAKALNTVDIEIYKQSDNSHIAYFKAKNYALWDISYTTFQHSIIYDGSSSATVPSGTMIWSLSSCNKTILSPSGTLSQTGTPVEDTDLVTKAYVDNAIEEASVGGSGSTGDASTHNHDDRYYTESESNSRFYGTSRGALNTNTCYDGKLYMVASGSNVPCGSNYGVVFGMPYRQLTGNSTPDFGAQIFLPNGDDTTHPNSMFYRTALKDTWNEWQEVATKADLENVASHQGLNNTFTIAGTVGWYRIAEGDIDNITGIFEVRGNANSYHSSTILATTSSYNKYPSLACLGHSIYSSSKAGINKARIVYVSGSSSVKCYLEVYLASAVGMTVTVSSANAKGWTLMNGESGDTMPDGASKTEIGLVQGKMTGNLSGTSDYASKLSSARTITIGNQALTFNGGSDITFDLATMGVASASHGTHLTLGTGSGNAFRGDYGNTAYNHSQSAHAPSNAQKNSDITSSEIQAKLTGNITTHTHSQYLTQHQDLSGYAKTSDLHSHSNKSVLDGITSTNITNWNNKSNLALGTTSSTAFRGDFGNTAYQHSQTTHAPSNAQKNSDITKNEIETKLTGNITTHTHSQYLTQHQSLTDYAKKALNVTFEFDNSTGIPLSSSHTSTEIINAFKEGRTVLFDNSIMETQIFESDNLVIFKYLRDASDGIIEWIGCAIISTGKVISSSIQTYEKSYIDEVIANISAGGGEEVIFDSATDTLLSDYYTDFTDFMCYVGDVSIQTNSTSNPYNVTIDGVTYKGSDSSYDSQHNAWYWNVDGTRLYIHNDYDGQNKLVVTWDGFYYNHLVVTKPASYATKEYVDKAIANISGNSNTVYNVLDYGISPQNSDNTPKLQELMNTVHENGGGTIFFPIGTYKFSKAKSQPSGTYHNNHVYAILAKSNVSIVGENMENTILKCVDNQPYSLFYRFIGSGSDPLHGCTYSNFTVDCYDTGTYNQVYGKVFYYQYVKNCVFRDLILKGSIATAMGIDYLDNVEINNVTCIDCGRTFKSEESTSGTSGIGIGTGGYDNENFKITDCVCVGCGQYGIFIENQHTLGWGGTTDDSKGCVISNCIVRNGLYRGIGVRGGTNVIVSNCSTYGNTKDGIYLDNKCVNVKIANNNIVNNGANGILVKCNSASEDIVMSDNLIKNNTQYGIALNVSTNGLGLYNNITKKNSKGLYTMSSITHTDSVVRGNAFFDDTNITIDNFRGNTQFNDYTNINTTVTTVSAIECSDFTIPLGVTISIPYTVIPTYADKSRVTISTTSNIISIDNIAKTITGLSLGTATITLQADGVTKTVRVTVEEKALERITVANSQFTKGSKLGESGTTSSSSNAGVTGYIDIANFLQPKVCVTLNEFNKYEGARICIYDANKELLYTTTSYVNNNAFNYVGTHLVTIEKPVNARYIRVSYNKLGSGNIQIDECNHINSEITLAYSDFTIGKKLMPDGSESTESTGGVSEFIDVASLLSAHNFKSLAFKSISGASMGGTRIAYYDANKVGLSNSFSLSTSNRTESIPSGTKYVRVFISNIKTDSVISLTFTDIQPVGTINNLFKSTDANFVDGQILRSSGGTKAGTGFVTGYIQVELNDTIYVRNTGGTSYNNQGAPIICLYKASDKSLDTGFYATQTSYVTIDADGLGFSCKIQKSGVGFVRIQGQPTGAYSNFIVTKNEPIN